MNWILLTALLIGAVAAVLLIRFLIRYASRRGPVQMRIDSNKLSVPQQAESSDVSSTMLKPAALPKVAVPQHAEKSAQTVPASQNDSSAQPTPDLQVDKNVQFTVYRPATIVPNKWYPLVAFAHLSKRRSDAPKEEPDPVEEVRRQAARVLSDQPAQYEAAKLDRAFSVPRKGMLTFVPLIEGCEFNPPTQSVLWQKTVHKVEFEMTASAHVDGRDVEGQMTVYLGNIVLTEIPLRISVDSQYVAATPQQTAFEEANAEPYRKIFASYSHQDTEIVEDFEAYVQALGDQYLRDVQTLRSGEVWSEALERMIREATVFQLFWSSNSMRSKFVKQEWEYALALNKPGFIRPVYWEEPLPQLSQDLPPAALRRLHFYKFPETLQDVPTRTDSSATLSIGPPEGPDSKSIYCTRCGAANDRLMHFCANCGAPLSDLGGNQPLRSDATGVTTGGNEQAVPQAQVPAHSDHSRSIGAKKSILALVAFVAVGSLGYVSFMTTRSSKTYALPTVRLEVDHAVEVDQSIQLDAHGDAYSLVVRNIGPSTIRAVRIIENLPDDLEYVTSDPQPVRQEGPQVIVWQVADISENEAITIAVTVRLRRGLQPGERITTKPIVIYTDQDGDEKTVRFSVEPVRARSG